VSTIRTAICDLDGTLIDSDEALVGAFLALGVARESISFGHVIAEECERLDISLEAYLAAYDVEAAQPFPGVEELVGRLDHWAICSNKHPDSGHAELLRLGWSPRLAMFADVFDGPKRLGPVLDALDLAPEQVVFLGDTDHDRACAQLAGVEFALAGWNPRVSPRAGDLVLGSPLELLELLGL
jgi:HAD superfamily hydrolase (TIGR01549 family)